ncbi:2-oxoglutarate dehydrogenase E1 component [Candidatus Blochmanniella vafra str. BVAF]|uniref:oxoglutarate dehydrogenase (succinyl-transferring) n=1 Tax=Blochmanniella vafra (strain BVAF) TaxID=859654 RepID=E8Q6Y0_BLOVB|nr:2-oxoglutarate dehydrogenase E1 component [Candidatus Blochmannia vafer]ADV33727.1 2-oxoglutarate dehydrogenase E1 component [Candidatus Blochmannia vafer str. BVAF]
MYRDILEKQMNSSFLTRNNQSYINQIYEIFLKDPSSVDSDWRNVFQKWIFETQYEQDQRSSDVKLNKIPGEYTKYKKNQISKSTKSNNNIIVVVEKILKLINSFRIYGHQYAKLDPLGLSVNKNKSNFLELEYYKFENEDLYRLYDTNLLGISKGFMTIEDIHQFFKKIYCRTIGFEYMHILDSTIVFWIQKQIESITNISEDLNNADQQQFLKEIIAADKLEHYLGIKFPGAKRFSLEGGDVLIPMLKEIIRYSAFKHEIKEIFLGMAHRGRLNVLVNVLGKTLQDLIDEFYGKNLSNNQSGDVKYHQGLYSDIVINKHNVSLFLLFNPSHLEIVTPVVMGAARSRIDQLNYRTISQSIKNINLKLQNNTVLPIVIHGDAAISAQGVVQESFNMANTRAYGIGGTVHIVINNQIGFTTSNIYDLRSTSYCTDIAKMIQAPIVHINADDVNAVIFVTRFALNFRKKFNKDIVIDLVCYRRHGHNEADEPSVTQPVMYQKIHNHLKVVDIYAQFLHKNKIIDMDKIQDMIQVYRSKLEHKQHCMIENWNPTNVRSTYHPNDHNDLNQKTDYFVLKQISKKYLQDLAYCISNIPPNFLLHERVKKIYAERIEMALGKRLFDWGGAEILAYAVLLKEGYSIRLSGEDVARGTFFHRHAIIYDQTHGSKYIPLMNIQKKQGSFLIWDSVLSEESALAFEYGYSIISSKNTLVIWEAQFGDFSNGAQVVIDQFISSGKQKWNQSCGLVMLLPHGYEGQGPEHSSCRIERYLQLCAENNIRLCVPSTPAQIYHVLHQQMKNSIQIPLIIISPKSLLRNAMATSSIEDLTYGSFNTIFKETNNCCILNQINKVIMCTGKVYYDLLSSRDKERLYTIAIIRIEQLYPFPYSDIIKIINQSYSHVKNFIWCQEEPENQGAWYYIQRCFCKCITKLNMNITLHYVGRDASASPASGYFAIHQAQQKKIINTAIRSII